MEPTNSQSKVYELSFRRKLDSMNRPGTFYNRVMYSRRYNQTRPS